jgi:hemerythrin-like domain-containing protein
MRGTQAMNRRAFIRATAMVGGGLLLAGCAPKPRGAMGQPAGKTEEEVSPAEDLMREHGVLRRILLVYEEVARRLDANDDVSPKALADAAAIVRTFVEDYHEKLEEDFLFPRFRKANVLVELVDVLLEQHQAGRRLTDTVVRFAGPDTIHTPEDKALLVGTLRGFIRMYAPHAAREDTVLFSALHTIVPDDEYDKLGEQFEDKEHDLFGEGGFEKMVERVSAIEKVFGTYELKQFTPAA